ncbi:MAG: hypothetical protein IJK07_10735 [Bacteroidales bacterium]|nr:hypothetical protein [Bacteroidales bacterium]
MKKILSFTIIAFCMSFCAKTQDVVNLRMDCQQMGLRGYVASMDEDILLRKDYFREDWPQRKWFVKDLRNVLREDDGRIVTFNPAGRLLSVTYTHQGRQGKTTSCSYASNGLLSSFVGEGYKVEAKYNGNMADINVYAETKDYKSVNLAKADLNTTPYTNTYPFDLKCRQELDDDGLVLKSSYYYVDSLPAKVCEYSYNHNHLLVSEKITDYTSGEKAVSTVQYTYDNRDFLIKKVTHGKALDETCTYVNNEQGDCIKMTVERPYATIVYTFEYVYDMMDNWTVRLQYEDGIFDNAALRTLTYHKAPAELKAKADKKGAAKQDKAVDKKASKKSDKAVDKKVSKKSDKAAAVDKKAEKERKAAEKKAVKEAKASQKEEMKAQQARAKEAEKNMTKEQRKAAQAERKAAEKAAKEQAAAAAKAEKERAAIEKKAEKERLAAQKKAEKERAAALKKAEKERAAAEKDRKTAEKKAKKKS